MNLFTVQGKVIPSSVRKKIIINNTVIISTELQK